MYHVLLAIKRRRGRDTSVPTDVGFFPYSIAHSRKRHIVILASLRSCSFLQGAELRVFRVSEYAIIPKYNIEADRPNPRNQPFHTLATKYDKQRTRIVVGTTFTASKGNLSPMILTKRCGTSVSRNELRPWTR